MKNFSLLLLGLSVFAFSSAPQASAATAAQREQARQDMINQAYMQRFMNQYRTRSTAGVTADSQYYNIQQKRAAHNAFSTGSLAIRTGEMKDAPYYDQRRVSPETNYLRPNQQQVFRARALDYYVYGGNGSTESLQKDLAYGSTHQVMPNSQHSTGAKNTSAIIQQVRSAQKDFMSRGKTGEGIPRVFTYRKNGDYLNLPFVKKPFDFDPAQIQSSY